MWIFANEPASRFLSCLTIRTKTFIAAAVALICLVGMGAIAVLGSREVARNLDELTARGDLSAGIKAELGALDQKLQKYEGTARDVLDVGRTDPPMATMMLGQTDDSFTEIESNIREILNALMAESYSIVKALLLATSREMLSLGIGLITCFLVSVAAIAFVARSIVKPITSITNSMQRLANGDTAVRLDYADR